MRNGTLGGRPFPAFVTDRRIRCTPEDGDLFFPLHPSAEVNEQVKQLCWPCPLRADCLAHGLRHEPDWGHFGGLSPQARRALQRRRAGLAKANGGAAA